MLLTDAQVNTWEGTDVEILDKNGTRQVVKKSW